MQELLAVNGVEALIVTTVDDHVERVAVDTHVGQTAGDECLVLHGIELGVDTEHVGKLLGAPTHGVDKVVAGVFHVVLVVTTHEHAVLVTDTLYAQHLAVLEHLAAMLLAHVAHIVDGAARGSLPAVLRNQRVAVDVVVGIPVRRDDLSEVLAVNHVGLAPGARSVERAVGGIVVHEVDIAGHLQVDVAVLLVVAEDFQVVHGDITDVGVGERGTSTADAAPRRAAVIVHQDDALAGLGKVAEGSTTSHTAASDDNLGLGLLDD